jgi:Toastrack DUF4097
VSRKLAVGDESGDISITGTASLNLTVTDQSGNVVVRLINQIPQRVNIRTESGNIILVLPSSTASYEVNAHTSGGTPYIRVPTDFGSPYVINVVSDSGTIAITR